MPVERLAKLRVAAALVPVVLAASCLAPPPSEPVHSTAGINVTGTIDQGPAPSCPTEQPCDLTPKSITLVFSRTGGEKQSVRVAGDGSFALHLDPGEYSISVTTTQMKVEPSVVRVPTTGMVYLQLHIARSS